VVGEARRLAALAAEPVIEMARTHPTVAVERATLRLAGLSDADRRASPPARAPAPSRG
jgi:beta-lysine 5,6-aminomutase alpha subunit